MKRGTSQLHFQIVLRVLQHDQPASAFEHLQLRQGPAAALQLLQAAPHAGRTCAPEGDGWLQMLR